MLARLKDRLLFPFARLIINAQSTQAWVKAMGKRPVVHFQRPYEGQPILLLAMYEKGDVRPDVLRMLRIAHERGLYILAVNTLKLKPEAIDVLRPIVGCYIERPNFGRDFGSYRTGFLHFYDLGWDSTCPRLLMLNDSVYFNETRLPKFYADMMDSSVEVLGSTENYEIEYHLGSFCIAIARTVFQQSRFRTYWRNYSLTDVRPAVIKRGEMALSKSCVVPCLRRIN